MSSAPVVGTKGVPRAERERQIVAVAVDEFAEHGFARASMVEIAAGAGITKPLIYQYFGSKDGLYLACLHQVAGGLLERLQQAQLREDDSVASRVNTLEAIFDALEPQRSAWPFLYDTSMPQDGPIAATARGYRARMEQLAASGSARFLRSRGLRSTRDASALTAIWMGLVNSLVTWWVEHPNESAADMTLRCYRLIGAVTAQPDG